MSGTLPATPGFAEAALIYDQPVIVAKSESRRRQSRIVAGHMWKISVSYPPMTRDEFAPIFAFAVSQRGAFDTFTLTLPQHDTPRGTATGTPLVEGIHAAGSSSVAISGFTIPTQEVANGEFSTSDVSQWDTVNAAVTIAGTGLAVINYSGANAAMLDDNNAFEDGQDYIIEMKLNSYTSGSLGVYAGGVLLEGLTDTNAKTYNITGSSNGLFRTLTTGFVGDIDYIRWYKKDAIMKASDIIKYANHSKVYMVTADGYVDYVTGIVTLNITPPLIEALADNEVITVNNVPFTVALKNAPQEFKTKNPSISKFALDLEEAII